MCQPDRQGKFLALENVISEQTREEILGLIRELYATDREAGNDIVMRGNLVLRHFIWVARGKTPGILKSSLPRRR